MTQITYIDKSLSESFFEIISIHNPEYIFVVTGKESFLHSGAKDICENLLKEKVATMFDDFSSNPKLEDIEKGISIFRETNPDLVLAIGGGSAIDIAKAVTILAAHEGEAASFIRGEKSLESKGVPLVAVPTTAGTGAEATHFSAVYIGPAKYSLAHEHMLPDYVILDPVLTHSLSPRQTALSGMDALCQAIESMWSIKATEESRMYAREALALVWSNLRDAVTAPNDEVRAQMLHGAHLAGKAINISKTTASHAMSYALTAHFAIPHGQAVGITLPELFSFNSAVSSQTVADPRGVTYVHQTMQELSDLLGGGNEEAPVVLTKLLGDIGLATTLSTFGIRMDDIDMLVEEMSLERAGNNPRIFTKEDARRLLCSIV